jgi:hypothetical protein
VVRVCPRPRRVRRRCRRRRLARWPAWAAAARRRSPRARYHRKNECAPAARRSCPCVVAAPPAGQRGRVGSRGRAGRGVRMPGGHLSPAAVGASDHAQQRNTALGALSRQPVRHDEAAAGAPGRASPEWGEAERCRGATQLQLSACPLSHGGRRRGCIAGSQMLRRRRRQGQGQRGRGR